MSSPTPHHSIKPVVFSAACRRVVKAFDGQKSLRLGEIAQRVDRSRGAVCRSLKKLSKYEIVQRVKLTNSRASLVFFLSPKGCDLKKLWFN